MTKRKLKRAVGGSTDRWVKLPHYLLKCRAWRTMPHPAKALLLEVWVRHNGVNNGEISFGCSEAPELLGFSEATAARMFDILIERGFLVVVRDACFDAKSKKARTWRITAEPAGGKPATKDCMRWQPAAATTPDKNHFTVSPMRPTDLIHETKDRKLTKTVSSVRPTEPISDGSRFHQCNTYNLPTRYGSGDECRRSGTAPTEMPADWRPAPHATHAAVDAGLRYSDIFPAVERFRARHLGSGEVSADWDAEWLATLRAERRKEGTSGLC